MSVEFNVPAHSRKLKNPPLISDFLKEDGQEISFEAAEEEMDESFDVEHDLDYEQVQKFVRLDLLDIKDGETGPLDHFKKIMTKVPYGPDNIEDYKLLKKIKEPGTGNCPTLGSYVHIHYMYHTELNELPIDITYLRQMMPEKFKLGESGLIPAFEYAILSMKKGEKSDFFASYELCFGAMGCPPRIPAEADLLFEIKLLSFSVAEESLNAEGNELDGAAGVYAEPTFEQKIKKVKDLGFNAKARYNVNNVIGAIRNYREAVNILFNVQSANAEEQRTVEQLLTKNYKNLIILHNKQGHYKRACECGSKALQFANEVAARDVGIHFLWGKALSGLQEWDRALSKLHIALKLAKNESPEKRDISKEIENVLNARNKYNQKLKTNLSKMYNQKQSVVDSERKNTPKEKSVAEPDCRHAMEIFISSFKMKDNLDRQIMGSKEDFSQEDIDIIKEIAKKMGVRCEADKQVVLFKD